MKQHLSRFAAAGRESRLHPPGLGMVCAEHDGNSPEFKMFMPAWKPVLICVGEFLFMRQ